MEKYKETRFVDKIMTMIASGIQNGLTMRDDIANNILQDCGIDEIGQVEEPKVTHTPQSKRECPLCHEEILAYEKHRCPRL